MNKENWIKVIEQSFVELKTSDEQSKTNKNTLEIENEKLILRSNISNKGSRQEICFPLAQGSNVFTVSNIDEIIIATKDMRNDHTFDEFRGECIVVNKEIKACILISLFAIHFIPWDKITVISAEFQADKRLSFS